MNSKVLVGGTVGVVIIAVFIVVFMNQSNGIEDIATEFDEAPSIEGQPVLGDETAPIQVIEFGDYKCPSCKAWDETVFPRLQEEYIDTGIVQFVHINTPFHGGESVLAAQASESVWDRQPEAFWDFHKEIYRNQPESQQHDEQWVTREKLLEIAESVDSSIDLETLSEDIEDQAYESEIGIDVELINRFEVTQTPTIMVNNYKVTNPFEYDSIVDLIEMERE
ncbi:periplasmic thiol:disulfide interchange protein DsbA [Bacillus sp. JCM 19046]|nr:periplasmic thiol:disulfide interchange protein DsbA [Bacillus sp. JCM 19045]GAF18073.1 periplasmic thiol:disulfide interchange protein DsbA [Bacillus sp. JCM 19046]